MNNDKMLQAIGDIDEDLIDRAGVRNPTASADAGRRITWLRWAAPVAACLVIALAIAVPTWLKQPPTDGGGYASDAGSGGYGGYASDASNNGYGGYASDASSGGYGGYASGAGNDGYGGTDEPTIGGKSGINGYTEIAGDSLAGSSSGSSSEGAPVPAPSLSLDSEPESAACYAALEDWRGLPTAHIILNEQTDDTAMADRMPFTTLDDLAAYADAFILVSNVHKTARESDNWQTSIAEYAESIGDRITTRAWDDYTISTGSRVLIRQRLIGGCTMDEPNNLLREGGVYVLPIRFNPDGGAYEVVGDLDVLFELNDEGKIVSHSGWEGYNQYDGKSLPELLDAVRALYPAYGVEFTTQPINTVEQAENQVITAYNASGFRQFAVVFDAETVISGADVYVFKVSFGGKDAEYAAIAKENGAFIRGELLSDGEMQTYGGLGSFPWHTEARKH